MFGYMRRFKSECLKRVFPLSQFSFRMSVDCVSMWKVEARGSGQAERTHKQRRSKEWRNKFSSVVSASLAALSYVCFSAYTLLGDDRTWILKWEMELTVMGTSYFSSQVSSFRWNLITECVLFSYPERSI